MGRQADQGAEAAERKAVGEVRCRGERTCSPAMDNRKKNGNIHGQACEETGSQGSGRGVWCIPLAEFPQVRGISQGRKGARGEKDLSALEMHDSVPLPSPRKPGARREVVLAPVSRRFHDKAYFNPALSSGAVLAARPAVMYGMNKRGARRIRQKKAVGEKVTRKSPRNLRPRACRAPLKAPRTEPSGRKVRHPNQPPCSRSRAPGRPEAPTRLRCAPEASLRQRRVAPPVG